MHIVVAPSPGAFAREVVGVDCSAPLTAGDISEIDAAMERHAVLVIRDQPLTDEQQLAFTRQFGALERYETPGISASARKKARRRNCGFLEFARDGKIMSRRIAFGSSSLATGCGIPTVRSVLSRPNIPCCQGARSRRAEAIPSLPTCAPPTTLWTTRARRRSRTWCASTL